MTVTIQSYVVHPVPGQETAVAAALAALPGCEVLPAENRPVMVLVTETPDRASQRQLERQLEAVENIAHIALVSGWNDNDEEVPA